jgi:hypothetical protein
LDGLLLILDDPLNEQPELLSPWKEEVGERRFFKEMVNR